MTKYMWTGTFSYSRLFFVLLYIAVISYLSRLSYCISVHLMLLYVCLINCGEYICRFVLLYDPVTLTKLIIILILLHVTS